MSHDPDDLDIAELIARSPGAQPRQKAIDSIKARRQSFLASCASPPPDPAAEDVSVLEPMPVPEYPDPPPPPPPRAKRKPSRRDAAKPPAPRPTKHPHLSVLDGDKPPPKSR
jgi:hypothetical protein